MSGSSLQAVVERCRHNFMKMPGVVGVGAGISPTQAGERRVLVYSTMGEWPPALPKQVEGYVVEIVKKSKGFRAL